MYRTFFCNMMRGLGYMQDYLVSIMLMSNTRVLYQTIFLFTRLVIFLNDVFYLNFLKDIAEIKYVNDNDDHDKSMFL